MLVLQLLSQCKKLLLLSVSTMSFGYTYLIGKWFKFSCKKNSFYLSVTFIVVSVSTMLFGDRLLNLYLNLAVKIIHL